MMVHMRLTACNKRTTLPEVPIPVAGPDNGVPHHDVTAGRHTCQIADIITSRILCYYSDTGVISEMSCQGETLRLVFVVDIFKQ